MMQPRERRFQRTKQAILDAALEIIREEGPGALNIRRAGRAQRLQPRPDSTSTSAARTRSSRRCASRDTSGWPATCGWPIASLPVVDYLYEIGIGYIRFALENPDYFLLMFTVVAPGPTGDFSPEKLLEGDSSFHILLGAIRRGIEEGAFVARHRLRPDGDGLHGMGHRAWHRHAAGDQPPRLPDGF